MNRNLKIRIGVVISVVVPLGLLLLFTNASKPSKSLLRHSGAQPECYQYVKSLMSGSGKDETYHYKRYCPDKSNLRPYWSVYTVGWTDAYKSQPVGPSWDVWLTRDASRKYVNEFEIRQTSSAWWRDTSPAPEENGATKRCALREVGIGFDWADSGLARHNGKEPTLADFSLIYFGAEFRNTAQNVGSTCIENPHDFLSLDFIYDYEVNGKVLVTNAIHVVISKNNYRDNYGSQADDILYSKCDYHKIYGTYTCQTLIDGSKWGIHTVGNGVEAAYKNVNAEFLLLAKNLEGRRLLQTCSGCTWKDAKIRHLQIVSSTRGGARFVKVRRPFAWGVPK